GLIGPVLSDRTTDLRRLLLPVAALGALGCVGIWLAPLAAPWLWAAVVGLGQGASFSLGLVLLVRYAATPDASGRLTGMAFFASYSIASVGPVAMGLVRDVTGGLSLVWAVLAVVGVVQGLIATRLRPGLRLIE
ncbi:MAG: MFS transporter, partial [Humibacillus sp.]